MASDYTQLAVQDTSPGLLEEQDALPETNASGEYLKKIEQVEAELHFVFKKCRAFMFSLAFVIVFPASVGVLCMLFYCLFEHDALQMTTKILVIADTFWKASYYTFCTIGVVTVMSAAVGSEDDNDWVRKFWSIKSPVNINSWQATGFILKPLGLFVLGTFLFVTQIVLQEHIKTGKLWLELSEPEKEEKMCFFTEQVDWKTAWYGGSYEGDPNASKIFVRNFQKMKPSSETNCESFKCSLDAAQIKYTAQHSVEEEEASTFRLMLHVLWDFWRKYVRVTPPSQCYNSDKIRHWPAFSVPDQDFELSTVDRTKPEFVHFEFAPVYLGGDGPIWNRTYYFSESLRSACQYECSEWAEETAVAKLLQLSMVVGGGMAIVAMSDYIGGKLGNKLIDQDTSVKNLAQIISGDIRVSLSAMKVGSLKPWRRHPSEQQRVYFNGCWWALMWLLIYLICALSFTLFVYRRLVVKYSESMADRGLVRCIFYVGLFNTALRSLFCFTKEMWHTGEDAGFHMQEESHEGNAKAVYQYRRFSFDLYDWMRLDANKMIELLFDYIYNLGEAELGSDEEIEVKMRFETTEDQYHIPIGATGTIRKRKSFGAVYEGSKVFVHFPGNQITKDGEQLDSKRSYKIPIEKNSLAQRGADKDEWQVELKKFLCLDQRRHSAFQSAVSLLSPRGP